MNRQNKNQCLPKILLEADIKENLNTLLDEYDKEKIIDYIIFLSEKLHEYNGSEQLDILILKINKQWVLKDNK